MTRLNISVLFIACLAMLVIKATTQQHQISYRGSEERYAIFVKHVNTILDVVPIMSVTVQDIMSCVFSCLENALCMSFNVAPDADKYECHLLATDKYNSSNKLKSSKAFNHFSIKSPCESSPCQNGGTCRPGDETKEYKCACVPGFFGTHCQDIGFTVGARVFARWNNVKYYKGIIDLETANSFRIQCDIGGEIQHSKTDSKAIVMDIEPPKSAVTMGTEVIAWWDGSRAYYPSHVDQIDDDRYHIKYEAGEEGWARIDQIRVYNA